MTTAHVRKPTKKAFHFPKSPDTAQEQAEAAQPAESADQAVAQVADKATDKATDKAADKVAAKGKTRRAKPNAKTSTKSSTKTSTKGSAKPRAKAAAQASEAAEAPAPKTAPKAAAKDKDKPKRAKKEKVVRDSFTMPKADYERIALLKRKCLDAGVAVKKSELLRAGLQLLEAASEKRLVAAVAALEAVKTGRPSKSESKSE